MQLLLNIDFNVPWLVFGFGSLIMLCVLTKAGFDRFSLPSIVGYLLVGMLLSFADREMGILNHSGEGVLSFLSAVGVIVLLFRVGIESNLHALLHALPKAAKVWVPDMLVSSLPTYFITRYLLGYGMAPSLFVAVAMTATSVGVSVAVWKETHKLDTKEGGILLDTAELDDISGVAFMALLFSIAPVLKQMSIGGHKGDAALISELGNEAGLFAVKFIVFIAMILALGRYLEAPLAHVTRKIGNKATVLIFVGGCGFSIAGLAGMIGLSLPIGALFAGLLLSRHREDYGFQPFYRSLYLLFMPFFFIHIGFQINPHIIMGSLATGVALTFVALISKVVGTGCVTRLFTNTYGVLLIGASMVPRAEVAMIVVQRGKDLGDWAMPDELYAAMVFVSAATCMGAAIFLHWALRRW